MEFILHFMYVVAIKDARAWRGDSPFELSMIGFWNLMIVWLKVRSQLIILFFVHLLNHFVTAPSAMAILQIMGTS